MILFDRNTDNEIVIIAEVGMNHEGSINWIFEILPRLKEADVDAVKFQLFTPHYFVSPKNIDRFQRVSAYSLSREQFDSIYEFGKSLGLPIFATPVSHDWVDYIADMCGVVKIASGDFNFLPTVDRALNSKAKVIMSTGATTRNEIVDFINRAKIMRPDKSLQEDLALLHCISAYPPNLEEANLNAIPDLKKISGLTVGFSSHFIDDAPIYAAVGLGARIFEIHVTLDRNQSDFRDHALSRTPEEMKQLVSSIRKLNYALQSSTKELQPSEKGIVSEIRKGFVYAKSLRAGHLIQESDVTFARPASETIVSLQDLVGQTLARDVEAYEPIRKEHLR